MGQVTRIFCTRCNPQCFYQRERRKLLSDAPPDNVLPFPRLDQQKQANQQKRSNQQKRNDEQKQANQRKQAIRRMVHDRRLNSQHPANQEERRNTIGRRPFDGYVWFEGCLEEAIQEQWYIQRKETMAGSETETILCPKCSKKFR